MLFSPHFLQRVFAFLACSPICLPAFHPTRSPKEAFMIFKLAVLEQVSGRLTRCPALSFALPYACSADDGGDSRRDFSQGSDAKEYCLSDHDIVEVVRTEYVYTRPPPWSDALPTIHVVTPTYSRPVQKAELTRLANTFLHVLNLHWILVEDSQRRTPLVTRLLRDTGLNYTHLNVETPRNYKLRGDMRDPRIPRGTMQRNLALRWLRETFNRNSSQLGVVYFADDDNTYSLELFEEVSCRRWADELG